MRVCCIFAKKNNKAVIDHRLRPQCCHLESYFNLPNPTTRFMAIIQVKLRELAPVVKNWTGRQTDTVITVLHSPIGGGVITFHCLLYLKHAIFVLLYTTL